MVKHSILPTICLGEISGRDKDCEIATRENGAVGGRNDVIHVLIVRTNASGTIRAKREKARERARCSMVISVGEDAKRIRGKDHFGGDGHDLIELIECANERIREANISRDSFIDGGKTSRYGKFAFQNRHLHSVPIIIKTRVKD